MRGKSGIVGKVMAIRHPSAASGKVLQRKRKINTPCRWMGSEERLLNPVGPSNLETYFLLQRNAGASPICP